ncbi:MAG: Gfo/Idh/MocA family oxidoreductase [Pirellulales bacterium]|nr:Gfo/Idh/MocA family oxidoreductase [Pirellulales bacterium]
MRNSPCSRRDFFKSSVFLAGPALLRTRSAAAAGFVAANERPRMAAIGTGSRWYIKATGIDGPWGAAPEMQKYGDYVAVCDVDASRCERAAELVRGWSDVVPSIHHDYRAVLDNPDIDLVHISTPDHWHAKIAIEALLAGKDVYCEKPLTLTIAEGRQINDVCRQTGRVVQVGTQQRSEQRFITAVAIIRAGRLGKVRKATCCIGGAPASPKIPVVTPPAELDWNMWQGPVSQTEFRYLAGDYGETKSWSRCHYEFRWWYEYSGGKLTDWGAHHVDIATWGLDKAGTGPVTVNPVFVRHPVEFQHGYPVDSSRYNTATEFLIRATFDDGIEIELRHDGDNGVLFEGTDGRIFVNRSRITGKPVEDLKSNPLPAGALEAVYKNRPLVDHFRNFFESVRDRLEPISDVFSHHRALSTCHLAGIAARFNRQIRWDPVGERILGDPAAQQLVGRDYRRGFEIEMS